MNPVMRWDYLNYHVQKCVQTYARKRASNKELIISQLSEKVMLLENSQDLQELAQTADIYERTKIDLDQLLMEKAKSLMFCMKTAWYEFEGKSSSYFYRLEKARHHAKTVHCLINEYGNNITEDNKILQMQSSFYKKTIQQ